ncbi:DNA primase family protein [Mycobacteroides abscessus]|uniref:DNA primase family protein n=1 Tax=Mycobacteroides abscessus TaxID=36809 RepID=UPI0009277D4C|nr:phage/plasmid primase, P4 family [Mycobacteroides abscessus]SHX64972.1 bacteriophage protein [Mycobacteroides abscessus subsp. abscessus]SHZ17983.1 bacteriophage protein [Mycobacteroides abscessus subsp. abscessus]SIB51149.1 bacteriophage protein [Mycobacteroides abscessus subsp. abscessus]SIF18359.1 bacteriophage protein [Mycobacteroides abscessus subsp. abscessus]SKI48226.1 bacteriophage protein [Mycobacteroides abscessus subsp. abscessus]
MTDTAAGTPAPYPGLRLTDTKPSELLPDRPDLPLEDYLSQPPSAPPVTVEATHAQVADAVRAVVGDRLIRTFDKTWMTWDGRTWKPGNDETAENIVKSCIARTGGPRLVIPWTPRKATVADAPGLIASGEAYQADDGLRWTRDNSPVTHIPVAADQWAETSVNLQGVRRALAGGVQRAVEFDADPTLLNCQGLVLEMHVDDPQQPYTVRELRPGDHITRSTRVTFDPSAACPRWERFIAEVLPDPEVAQYVQMAMGMSIFGVIRDHVFFVLRGRGRNGKSKLLEICVKVLGTYGNLFPETLIAETHGEQHPTELMDLRGCRLAAVSETPQGKRLHTNRVKRLAGGDTIKARAMRQDYVRFAPSHTLWVGTNNRMLMSDPDPALFDRLREVPFTQQWWVPGDPPEKRVGKVGEADLGLEAYLEQHELPGILRWMVDGWAMYVRNGAKLTYPSAVVAATRDAQESATTFSVFSSEAFERGFDHDYVEPAAVFAAWKAYLKSESMHPSEKPTRNRDVGEFLMREFSYANSVPRKNGRDTAKVYGLRWTEAGRAWASLDDTTAVQNTADSRTGPTVDGKVILIGTSRGVAS